MSNWTSNQYYLDCCKKYNNKYRAIQHIQKITRQRLDQLDGCILESQALSWTVTGVEPKEAKEYRLKQKYKQRSSYAYFLDRLDEIYDEDVKDAVKTSIAESRKIEHLIYYYNKVYDKSRRSRVRVLSTIIWYNMMDIDIEESRELHSRK